MLALLLLLVVADEVVAYVAVVLDEGSCAHFEVFWLPELSDVERLGLFVEDAGNIEGLGLLAGVLGYLYAWVLVS
jgi:hypothetical protein